jgi:DNA-binding GntR family transcriptional regulator
MSFEFYRWAKSQKGLSPPEKNVLVAIADYINNEEGYAWPSQAKLAEDTSYSRATVHRACRSLQKKGLLSWSKVMRSSGHFSSNRYVLHRVAECGAATSHSAKKDTAVLQRVEAPCSTAQQKPLDRTLNNTNVAKKGRVLSEKQKALAEKMAVKLLKAHPNEHHQLPILIKDCEDFLSSPQREEDWVTLGNGLPNPFV